MRLLFTKARALPRPGLLSGDQVVVAAQKRPCPGWELLTRPCLLVSSVLKTLVPGFQDTGNLLVFEEGCSLLACVSFPEHMPGWPGPCPGNSFPQPAHLADPLPSLLPLGGYSFFFCLLRSGRNPREADTGGEGSTAPSAPPLPGDDATQAVPCFPGLLALGLTPGLRSHGPSPALQALLLGAEPALCPQLAVLPHFASCF